MKSRNPHASTREALAARARARLEELARLHLERFEGAGQGNDLRRLLERYQQHRGVGSIATAAEARRLSSFSERMTEAVHAHADLVERLSRIGQRRR